MESNKIGRGHCWAGGGAAHAREKCKATLLVEFSIVFDRDPIVVQKPYPMWLGNSEHHRFSLEATVEPVQDGERNIESRCAQKKEKALAQPCVHAPIVQPSNAMGSVERL